jgi:lipopolysaccharide export LptBFGC system permease protein LptF
VSKRGADILAEMPPPLPFALTAYRFPLTSSLRRHRHLLQPREQPPQRTHDAVVPLAKQRGEDVSNYMTALQRKLSFPLSCLLMTLLGFVVVADVHARRFARGVTLGLVIAIGFYVLDAFFSSLGKKGALAAGELAPMLVGWAPLAVFAVIVGFLFTRMRRIRG